MNLRLKMHQAAAQAPNRLRERTERVAAFLRSRMNLNGGFRGRSSGSDLYYTVFGVAGLSALGAPFPTAAARQYVDTFGDGDGLDLTHLVCLARCHAMLEDPAKAPSAPAGTERERRYRRLRERLESFRSADGGYSATRRAPTATAYASFLAAGAIQDLGGSVDPEVGRCLAALRTSDGGFANEPGQPHGLTAPTAAVAVLLKELGQPVPDGVGRWLRSRGHREGGFVATATTPIPDLLSTATALHALERLGEKLEADVRQPCRAFIDGLASDEGGFRGHWADDAADCEYTWYGLLALGHLDE